MRKLPITTILLAAAAAFTACSADDEANSRPPLRIPAAYDGTTFDANTTTQLALLNQLNALTNEAKLGRTPGVVVSYDNLTALYNVGNPSLAEVSTPYFAALVDGEGGWLYELALSSGGTYTPGPPTGQGGTLGAYLFDENGLELEQLVEKGQFGAVLYKHATDLLAGPISASTVDQLVAIFGANPTFPNTPSAANTPRPDRAMANYAARRDKNDGKGLYTQMENAFIKLQAAVNAGANYHKERDEAIAALTLTWEKVNAATIINYCHTTISVLSSTNPTPAQVGNALHAYAEGVGFIHGWKTIPQQRKRITDAEIDQLLVLFNAPAGEVPTSYRFATDPVNELPKLQEVISRLQTLYGFTNQEIEDFRSNWVAQQGR